ncbi:MAG: sensor histidine kinase [Sulfurimicrobium sp.]|jgi:signal transduction histidine kinase|nr:sensor histidine kinase [Sulfurimicrobium sp.]MDP2198245.1 sensor histidine kinase [Sulfurimicrobium sp.]MDP2964228.1 sensor histidine kinase [Sulfurimicrobium sp.]MDZ7656662.1 sensor histidine kinase [Sulfurimicrobium sp.]
MNGKISTMVQRMSSERPHWLLAGMLLSLHAALAWGVDVWWSSAALLVHLGLFLMWQPMWRSERRLSPSHVLLVFLGGGALILFWHSWWAATLWVGILVGLIGGDVVGMNERRQRIGHLLALLYLLSILLLWVVPHLFGETQGESALLLMVRYGLVAVPLLAAASGTRQNSKPVYAVDFFYSLMLFLLVVVLVLGSFAVKMISQSNYPMALAQTLMGIAGVLFVLSWLWNPHGGFAGVGQLMSRYLLSVGLPFERWLRNLAALAEQENDAVGFLRLALEDIAALPWVAGGRWQAPGGGGEFGVVSKHSVEFTFHQVRLVLFTRWALSPALILHVKLLTQLLGHFYEAKQREQEQKYNAYTQAIYETGARLTHDVKNLLQSMKTLSAAVESSDAGQAQALQALMQRQLPQIVQRLQLTLDKLKSPNVNVVEAMERVSARAWWEALQERYAGETLEFAAYGMTKGTHVHLPGELFDSVADNLLQNALEKRKVERGLGIRVGFSCEGGGRLTVCDDGYAMDDDLASRILTVPVQSHNGLGVGLYQAGRLAQQAGYRLALTSNQEGRVCFELIGSS